MKATENSKKKKKMITQGWAVSIVVKVSRVTTWIYLFFKCSAQCTHLDAVGIIIM